MAPLRALQVCSAFAVATWTLVAAASSRGDDERWFCSVSLPWEECKTFLPSETVALKRFLGSLRKTGVPGTGDFQGRGIVMSGGPLHVMEALSNLYVLRQVYHSALPVEFWHAYELEDFHCEALAQLGARCRALQVPGVYPKWQTTLPAIMSSSFREVLWLDTDVTPLMDPEALFETAAFRREGALFWPDLWGSGCPEFGESSRSRHVSRHLLNFPYNESDPSCTHEHEAGHLLVDKLRHWRPLCLANYLASRDFFASVLHGYKDVFRLAWLKLKAPGWLSPLRPGLVGLYAKNGLFFPTSLVHFWPAGEEPALGSPAARVPIYVHQKKKVGAMWQDIVTFPEPLGQCTGYRMHPFDPANIAVEQWDVAASHPELADNLTLTEEVWNRVHRAFLDQFSEDPRVSEAALARMTSRGEAAVTKQMLAVTSGCSCDYSDNRWFSLVASLVTGRFQETDLGCRGLRDPKLDTAPCPIGFLASALVCSNLHLQEGSAAAAAASSALFLKLLPAVEPCLGSSFWPLRLPELRAHAGALALAGAGAGAGGAAPPRFEGTHVIPQGVLQAFPAEYRRCVPLADPSCWSNSKAEAEAQGLQWEHFPHLACLHCCDSNMRILPWFQSCFDSEFTQERCCNKLSD